MPKDPKGYPTGPGRLGLRPAGRRREAGRIARTDFDLDEHRWRRFLVAMARIEETLDELRQSFERAQAENFSSFLERYPESAKTYKAKSSAWLKQALSRAEGLVGTAESWQARPRIGEGNIPRPLCDLRITPEQ